MFKYYQLLFNSSLILFTGFESYFFLCLFSFVLIFFLLFCYLQLSQEFFKWGWYQCAASVALFGTLPKPYVLFEKLRWRGNSTRHAISVCSQLSSSYSHQLTVWICSGCIWISISRALRTVKMWQILLLCFLSAVSCSIAPLINYIKQGIFHNTFIFSKLFLFSGTAVQAEEILLPLKSLASSVIVQCQEYKRVQIKLENTFPLDAASHNVEAPLGSMRVRWYWLWADNWWWNSTSDSSNVLVLIIIQRKKSVFSFSILKCGVVGYLFLKHILLVPLTMAAAALLVSCWMSQTAAPLLPGCTPEQRSGVALALLVLSLPWERKWWPCRRAAGGRTEGGGRLAASSVMCMAL